MDNAHLLNQIVAKQSFLCVGLDSDKKKLPACVRQEPDPMFAFNRRIVDATAPFTVAYKPNLAFYEAEGSEGINSLHRTVEYIKEHYPEIFVIADAKRGDIGNTATLYARSVFEASRFDAVTVAPYMGSDSVQPFLEFPDKKVIVLALTSNTGAADFQMMEEASTGERLFEKVLRTASQWGSQEQMMFVVGATKAELLQQVRSIVPNHFLLVPGVGAQGGSLEDVARYGMNGQCGLLVNSSRGIIFADNTERFDLVAGEKAEELQKEMAVLMAQFMNHKSE